MIGIRRKCAFFRQTFLGGLQVQRYTYLYKRKIKSHKKRITDNVINRTPDVCRLQRFAARTFFSHSFLPFRVLEMPKYLPFHPPPPPPPPTPSAVHAQESIKLRKRGEEEDAYNSLTISLQKSAGFGPVFAFFRNSFTTIGDCPRSDFCVILQSETFGVRHRLYK